MNIPIGLAEFHNIDLVEYANDALATNFHQEWLSIDDKPIGIYECIGYIKPLYLEGADEVSNLERCDIEVYWGICSQLIAKIRD